MEQEATENPCLKHIQMWTDRETQLLLDKYASYVPSIGPMNAFRNKKEMWAKISTEIEGRTAKQCEERYKTVKKRKKGRPSAEGQSVEFDQEFEAVGAMEDACFKSIQLWSESQTRLLFDKYNTYITDIGPSKAMKNKKDMWEKISFEIEGKTAKQCEERYKTVLKRRKACAYNNYTSKAKKRRLKYEQEFEAFEPEIVICNSSSNEVKGMKSIQKTLLGIAKRKEEGRERRHKEKMEALNNIQQTLNNLLQTNNFINL